MKTEQKKPREKVKLRFLRDAYLRLSRKDLVLAGLASILVAKGWYAEHVSELSARARLDWPTVFPCAPLLSYDR